jgi:hypothetical protein
LLLSFWVLFDLWDTVPISKIHSLLLDHFLRFYFLPFLFYISL